MRTFDKLKKLNKDELINRIYNSYMDEIISHCNRKANNFLVGKGLMFWEDIDFVAIKVYIGYSIFRTSVQIRPLEKFVHEYRLMTLEEVNIFIDFIDEITAISSIHKEKYKAIKRLNNWIQELII